jgi:hypothetical protein
MPDTTIKWEMGSNLSNSFGVALTEIKRRLDAFAKNMTAREYRESMYVGAEVVRQAIAAATPEAKEDTIKYRRGIGSAKQRRYVHKAGTAKKAVIIYERKKRSSLFSRAADLSLLVGYEKRRAYYMYWYEYGRENHGYQRARAFMIKTAEAAIPDAWQAIQDHLAAALNRAA